MRQVALLNQHENLDMSKNPVNTLVQPDQDRLIRMRDVIELTGISRTYIYALSATGKFPRSVPLVPGGTSRAWVLSEVEEWVNQRIAARDLEA